MYEILKEAGRSNSDCMFDACSMGMTLFIVSHVLSRSSTPILQLMIFTSLRAKTSKTEHQHRDSESDPKLQTEGFPQTEYPVLQYYGAGRCKKGYFLWVRLKKNCLPKVLLHKYKYPSEQKEKTL